MIPYDRNMLRTQHKEDLCRYVERFIGLRALALRIVAVMERLPQEVLLDFFNDSRFRMAIDDYVPGGPRTVWIASPDLDNGSRCVILKPLLAECPEDFAHYIIAHELAHAHLRNGGWGEVKDPELAADALAMVWGFSRPPRTMVGTAAAAQSRP